jgi:glycerophosphoryl diester phosphodiesterase
MSRRIPCAQCVGRWELGVDGIEIDVWKVEDELIVLHDARLERTTNGRGSMHGKSLAQLRALDAGKGEQIPLLTEVIEVIDRRAFLNIELKGPRTAALAQAAIERYVERGWRYEDFLVSSFRQRELRAITNRQIRRGLLLARPSGLYHFSARRVGRGSVHPALRYTTRRFVEDAHRRGWPVIPYTVNAPEDLERMRSFGVDGVFTDFPERLRLR